MGRKSIEEVEAWVKERLPGWEYYSDFVGTESRMKIIHECGCIREVSGISIKQGQVRCKDCYSKQQAEIKKLREQEKEHLKWQKKKTLKQRQVKMGFAECEACGNIFVSLRKKKYCSDRCSMAKRWKKREAYRYKVPLDKLALRDRDICYLCNQKVDWKDYKETPEGYLIFGDNYPSRDHVIPRSKGGTDTWDNIRLAHRGCNTLKGAAI